MDDAEARMRDLLVQLELTSNGRTASPYSTGGGDSDDIPSLGIGDAPHLHFKNAWDDATSTMQREFVVESAARALREIRHSRGDRRAEESKADRDRRIVEQGEGFSASEVAIWMRCGVTDVRRARTAAGREEEFGRRPRNGHALGPDQRKAEVLRLNDEGMNGRQIAKELGVAYNTVRRDLGRLD